MMDLRLKDETYARLETMAIGVFVSTARPDPDREGWVLVPVDGDTYENLMDSYIDPTRFDEDNAVNCLIDHALSVKN